MKEIQVRTMFKGFRNEREFYVKTD